MTTYTKLEITPGLIALLDALDAERSATILRALVALDLPIDVWLPLAETANRMLTDTFGTSESGDVIAAAIQIPVTEIRQTIRDIALSQPGPNDQLTMVQLPARWLLGTGQLAAAYALARAHDSTGVEVLLATVSGSSDPEQRVAAAHGLALLDPTATSSAESQLAALGDNEAIVEGKLFLGIALANLGHIDKLVEALIFADSSDAQRLYFGDPQVLMTDLEACRALPDEVFGELEQRLESGALPESARNLIESLPRLLITLPEWPSETDSHIDPADETAAQMAGQAILDQIAAAAGRPEYGDIPDLESSTSSMAKMSPSDAASFIQRILTVSSAIPDLPMRVGNWLVAQFVPALRREPAVDVSQLFDLGPGVHRDQVAWLMALAGVQAVVDALGPVVADTSNRERSERAAEFIKRAATYCGRRSGPVFGGGTSIAAPPPPTELFDMFSGAVAASVGGDDFAMAEPPTALPPMSMDDVAVPASDPAPPPPPIEPPSISPPDGVDIPAAVIADEILDGANGAPEAMAPDAPLEPAVPRFVQAVIRRNGADHRAFLAGARNQIVCWIGPEARREGDVHATADQPVDDRNLPAEGILLDVVLTDEDGGERDRGKLTLFPGNDRSGDCTLDLDVPANERFVSVQLTFLYRGRIFELVKLEAFVVKRNEDESADDAITLEVQASRREVLDLSNREPFDSVIVQHDSSILAVGPGTGNFTFAHLDAAVKFLNEKIFATSKSLVRAKQEGDAQTLDVSDADTRELLIDLAAQGNLLHRTLQERGFRDPGTRIQLVNLDHDRYVPIEFIYDRGNPSKDAVVHAECLDALARDLPVCPRCKPAGELTLEERDSNPDLCPYGFWSLQKVIERHDEDPKAPSTVGTLPSDALSALLPIRSVLYGVSEKVFPEDRAGLVATIESTFLDQSTRNPAGTWEQWKQQVTQGPSLLVALPHHDVADGMDFLEIGAGSQLELGRELELYVRASGQRPGPIMLLLGCETDINAQLGYSSFARAFSRHGAPVVIGTLSKIIGRHAVPVAQELVRELAAAHNDGQSLGALMLSIRRRLFVRGYLMALALVVHGDTDWRLTSTGGAHVPA